MRPNRIASERSDVRHELRPSSRSSSNTIVSETATNGPKACTRSDTRADGSCHEKRRRSTVQVFRHQDECHECPEPERDVDVRCSRLEEDCRVREQKTHGDARRQPRMCRVAEARKGDYEEHGEEPVE